MDRNNSDQKVLTKVFRRIESKTN